MESARTDERQVRHWRLKMDHISSGDTVTVTHLIASSASGLARHMSAAAAADSRSRQGSRRQLRLVGMFRRSLLAMVGTGDVRHFFLLSQTMLPQRIVLVTHDETDFVAWQFPVDILRNMSGQAA